MDKDVGGRASSARFWVVVSLFAVLNAGAWVAYHRYQPQIRGLSPLQARLDLPAGAVLGGRASLRWAFDRPVAPADTPFEPDGTGRPATTPARVQASLAPDSPGQWWWASTHVLAFTPQDPWPVGQEIATALSAEALTARDGTTLPIPARATLRTIPLAVTDVQQASVGDDEGVAAAITFNADVLPADVDRHLTAALEGTGVPVRVLSAEPARTVRVHVGPLPAGSREATVKLRLAAGLKPVGGTGGLDSESVHALAVERRLVLTSTEAHADAQGDARVCLRFNGEPDQAGLKVRLRVEPPVSFRVVGAWNGVQLVGPFQPATRYQVTLAPPPPGAATSPAKSVPAAGSWSVYVPDREPGVWFTDSEGYLSQQGRRAIEVQAVNQFDLAVQAVRIHENNLHGWLAARRRWSTHHDSYGRVFPVRRIQLPRERNVVQKTEVDLASLLPDGEPLDGVYAVRVMPAGPASEDSPWSYGWADDTAIVTLSDIGLTAKTTRAGLVVWATSLRTGRPLADVRVRVLSSKNQPLGEATTDAQGLARLSELRVLPGEQPALVIARAGGQTDDARPAGFTWLSLERGRLSTEDFAVSGRPYLREGYEAFLYSERGVYRPGETVRLSSIVRGVDGAVPPAFPVEWSVRRPDQQRWKTVSGLLTADGGLNLDLAMPADCPTGRWAVELRLPGASDAAGLLGAASFQVEDFIPDRMTVALKVQPAEAAATQPAAGPVLQAHVQADYLFGSPVVDAEAALVARIQPTEPGLPAWRTWTVGDAADVLGALERAPLARRSELPSAQLDERGRAEWSLSVAALFRGQAEDDESTDDEDRARRVPASTPAAGAPNVAGEASGPAAKPSWLDDLAFRGPWQLATTASVLEPGGRAVSSTTVTPVHLVPQYLAIRAPGSDPARPGSPTHFEIAAVRPDGTSVPGPASVETALLQATWNNSFVEEGGRYRYESTRVLAPVAAPQPSTLTDGRGTVTVTPPTDGEFVLVVRDPATGQFSSTTFYASQYAWWSDVTDHENPERVSIEVLPPAARVVWLEPWARNSLPVRAFADLVGRLLFASPAAPVFAEGDTARVLIRSPFPGTALLSVETDDVLSTRLIDLKGTHQVVEFPLTAAMRPAAYIGVSVVRPVEPVAEWRTHRAFGVARVALDPGPRRLAVALDAPEELRPASTLDVRIRVADAQGRPVANAPVTLAAVDEGILQLTRFATPDPLAFFTAPRGLGVATSDLYGALMPEVVRPDGERAVGGGDGSDFDPRYRSSVSARRVQTVALFENGLRTDADGLARASLAVPAFSGQLRLMAVAHAGPRCGSADGVIKVRGPVMVQSSWPRFVAPQDRFTATVVVFNHTDRDGQAEVDVAAGGESAGPELQLAADGSPRWNGTVDVPAGGQAAVRVPVRVPAAFGAVPIRVTATLGGEQSTESLELPIRPGYPMLTVGGVARATTSQPATIELPAGFIPGTQQLAVQVTPQPDLSLPRGLDYLLRYPYGCLEQTTSTAFPMLALGEVVDRVAPGTITQADIAPRVQAAIDRLELFRTPDGGLGMWPADRTPWPWGTVYATHFLLEAKAAGHAVPRELLDERLRYLVRLVSAPRDQPDDVDLGAYACYVLALAGQPERGPMNRLCEVLAQRPLGEATGARLNLACAWLLAGRRDRAATLVPDRLPTIDRPRELGANLGSAVREQAQVAQALLAIDPQHPALPGLIEQIAAAGRDRGWLSTQDTAQALLAIGRYLRQTPATAAPQDVTLLSSGLPLATGQGTLQWQTRDLSKLVVGATTQPAGLSVAVGGPADAVCYVSWLQHGVPATPPASSDHGVRVRRQFYSRSGNALTNPRLATGELVEVELTVEADRALPHLVIEDLLPAGLEIENPRLETAAAGRGEERGRGVLSVDRQDVRDDRLVLFGGLTAGGRATFRYLVRAVTPGEYRCPAVRAECMYDLSVNSVWCPDERVVVEARPAAVAGR